MSVYYFGDPWMPEQEVRHQKPAPIGTKCIHCQESIKEGDRGAWSMTYGVGVPRVTPEHLECQALGIIGHEFGVCRCGGFQHDRAAALELWRRIGEKGAR